MNSFVLVSFRQPAPTSMAPEVCAQPYLPCARHVEAQALMFMASVLHKKEKAKSTLVFAKLCFKPPAHLVCSRYCALCCSDHVISSHLAKSPALWYTCPFSQTFVIGCSLFDAGSGALWARQTAQQQSRGASCSSEENPSLVEPYWTCRRGQLQRRVSAADVS